MSNVRKINGWVEAVERRETRNGEEYEKPKMLLVGYAALFNEPSERMGNIIETIDPRAFDDVLSRKPDVRFQIEHTGLAIARTTNNTLRLFVDEIGLRFEAEINHKAQNACDLYYLVERGDITQMSFGFTIGAETVDDSTTPNRVTVTRVDRLFEISAVTFPAYKFTSVQVMPSVDGEMEDDDEPSVEPMVDDGESEDDSLMYGINVSVASARRLREEHSA